MYRILARGINHWGKLGDGLLLFCDETRDLEYFECHEYDLLVKFVDNFFDKVSCSVLRYVKNEKACCFDVYDGIRNTILFTDDYFSDTLDRLRERGYIIGSDDMFGRIRAKTLDLLASPSIALRYGVKALVDTDGYLWYFEADGDSEFHLHNICKAVTKHSIVYPDTSKMTIVLDLDKFKRIVSNCFRDWTIAGVEQPARPTVRCPEWYSFDARVNYV